MHFVIGLLLLLSLCNHAVSEKVWLPGATGSGPNDVAKAWAAAFVAKYPEAVITLTSVGSGSTQKALWGDIDCTNRPVEALCAQSEVSETIWGLGDAPIEPKLYDEHPTLQLQQFPACAGAVAVMYSKEVKDSNMNLSFDVLAGIFNQTILYWDDERIKTLNDNYAFPHERISMVVREDSSGQTSILTDAIDHNVDRWPDDAVGKKPNWPFGEASSSSGRSVCVADSANTSLAFSGQGKNGVALGMLRVPYSIGYMEMGFARRFTDFLAQANIKSGPNLFLNASEDSLRATMAGLADQLDEDTLDLNLARADAPSAGYPISGYAYWYLKRNESVFDSCYQAWLLCKFVEWSYSDPQAARLSFQNGWVVPPDSVTKVALQRLQEVRCIDNESSPPKVIAALSYTPPPYREKREFNFLWSMLPICVILTLVFFVWARIEKRKADSIWRVQIEDLVFGSPPEVVGQGSFGQVLRAEYRGTQVAVKRIVSSASKSSIASTSVGLSSSCQLDTKGHKSSRRREADFTREMRILAKLRHPCVTTILGAAWTDRQPMLVMEYMEHGSLYDILHNDTLVLDGDLLIPMLRDISQGIRFLHSAVPRVIHCDRKFRAKVADFGLSSSSKRFEGKCGTPFWMAPELITGRSSNTTASDMYAFGIMLYEVFSRKDPFHGEGDVQTILRKVADPNVQLRPPFPAAMPQAIKDIMEECVHDNPTRRPRAEEVDSRLQGLDVASVTPEAFGKGIRPKDSNVSLFDIFPRHVAEALRDGRKVEPQHKDCVTIFFSDIVGFTDISCKLAPAKVANLLDRLYHIFDDLSVKHDVFKVETIGDAYMAVTNLTKDQSSDHVKRIAMFAVEAIEAARNVRIDTDDDSLGFLSIRAGFHSGPVVADVVGNRNPRYCLFGDSYRSLKIALRGRINVKGKGPMVTYWVNEEGDTARRLDLDPTTKSLRNIIAQSNPAVAPTSPMKRVLNMVRGSFEPIHQRKNSMLPKATLRRSQSEDDAATPAFDDLAHDLGKPHLVTTPPAKSPVHFLAEKITGALEFPKAPVNQHDSASSESFEVPSPITDYLDSSLYERNGNEPVLVDHYLHC